MENVLFKEFQGSVLAPKMGKLINVDFIKTLCRRVFCCYNVLMLILLITFLFIFGLAVGSFLNVLIYRPKCQTLHCGEKIFV